MARYCNGSQQPVNTRTRRQQEDHRQMEFRRAIEDYSERRQLLQKLQELSDFPEAGQWPVVMAESLQSAPPVH